MPTPPPILWRLSRLMRVISLGLVFWVAPFGAQIEFENGWLTFSPSLAWAQDDDDEDDDVDDDTDDGDADDDADNDDADDADDPSGSSGGDDKDDSSDNSGSGSGGDGGNDTGGSSGSDDDDDSGDSTDSGVDDDDDTPSPGAMTVSQGMSAGSANGQVWTVLWVRVNGSDIEVRYTDGWTEIIRGDRYLLIDDRNRVAMDRRLRDADRARLAPLFP